MKELTTEQKAQRYDEAIEKGKHILKTPYTANWGIMKKVVEHILPELKKSEDDKKMLNQIISIIENADDNLVRPENISIYTNWLKSKVQPQLKWKPSELQIEALESATANCAYGEYDDCLKELIKQLKQF